MTEDVPQFTPPPDCETVLSVLGEWERAIVRQLAEKIIRRLSRLKAAGLFAEHSYSSIWGEYSHYVQNGEYEGSFVPLDDLVGDACEAVAQTVPPHEMQLFDRLAEACNEEAGMSGITYLAERLKDEVSFRASARNLDRYADDYRWFENL